MRSISRLARSRGRWSRGGPRIAHLFALTRAGARSLLEEYPDATVHPTVHFVPPRPDITPAAQRPRAVGMFGLVYRGKGFELLEQIRAALPSDIAFQIAGRGTQALPAIDGIEVLGEVNDSDQDKFFASVRTLLLPYGNRSPYGVAFPASSVVNRAIAYQTPMVCLAYGAMREIAEDGAGIVIDSLTDGAAVARAAAELVDDAPRLTQMAARLGELRTTRSPARVAADFAAVWHSL